VVDMVVVGAVLANLVRCIPLFVLTVAMKRLYLSSHVETSPSIAAIVTSHKGRGAAVTVDRAGDRYE
jgi:hypothetical protein